MEPELSVDLLVVGGGISGAGIAQDAASRGLKTALVEKADFAAGTSSKSSKQIHGGLRYLQHFSLGLMKQSISERHTLTRLAPGLVRWSPFLLPYYKDRTQSWKYSLGLWLYDRMAACPEALKHKPLNELQVLEANRNLRSRDLRGGALFFDCITDDARLVLAIVLDARERGARIFNYTAVEELVREHGRIVGAQVVDVLTRATFRIRARQVLLAVGPWTDIVARKFGIAAGVQRVRPAKGVHIVLPRNRIDLNQTVLIPSARDRRFLFVIPWYQGIVVGTTDSDCQADPDGMCADRGEAEYILEAVNWAFPDADVSLSEIVSSYAGIRPLVNVAGKSTPDVPREYRVLELDDGTLAVVGGKLTTYRVMAKAVVDRVVELLRRRGAAPQGAIPSWSHRIPLGNPPDNGFNPVSRLDLPADVAAHLIQDYGVWARQLGAVLQAHPQWGRRMAPSLPHMLAEAHFAVTRENARTLEDVLARRTRVALLAPDQGRGCAREVAGIMAKDLGWDAAETARQVEAFESSLRQRYRSGNHL